MDEYEPLIVTAVRRDESIACGRGMSECEIYGIAGLCGKECIVFQQGECIEFDEEDNT